MLLSLPLTLILLTLLEVLLASKAEFLTNAIYIIISKWTSPAKQTFLSLVRYQLIWNLGYSQLQHIFISICVEEEGRNMHHQEKPVKLFVCRSVPVKQSFHNRRCHDFNSVLFSNTASVKTLGGFRWRMISPHDLKSQRPSEEVTHHPNFQRFLVLCHPDPMQVQAFWVQWICSLTVPVISPLQSYLFVPGLNLTPCVYVHSNTAFYEIQNSDFPFLSLE